MLQSGDAAAARLLPELERFPDYGPGWLALGAFLQECGKYDAAVLALGRAARAMPQNAIAAHRLGQCLVAKGCLADAIKNFVDAVRIDPGLAEAWYSLGLAYQDEGDQAASVRAYRGALAARPDFHEAALNLGVALQETGDLDAALHAYGAALRQRPESLARIAQALTSGRKGILWISPAALRRHLTALPENSSGSDPNS